MRLIAPLAASALLLSACSFAPIPGAPTGPVAMTPFSWKGNASRAARSRDINECELAARGLPPNATQEMINAAAPTTLEQRTPFVNACLTNKGFVVTELPVCNESTRNQGTLLVQPDVLPPLENIRCLDPAARGLVVS